MGSAAAQETKRLAWFPAPADSTFRNALTATIKSASRRMKAGRSGCRSRKQVIQSGMESLKRIVQHAMAQQVKV
jgi:hypothetical protein